MNITKIYWKTKNLLEAKLQWFLKEKGDALGLLSHKEDIRDFLFGGTGTKPSHTYFSIAPALGVFDQRNFNICVFASAAMGASYQEGKRFSVKFYVKMAKRLGMITGNGFSYLRAAREISVKYGRLPYELMPDEIMGQSWVEYSKDTITNEMLEIAAKYKAPSYMQIKTAGEAVEALESGYSLFTGNKWYSEMNRPRPTEFFLNVAGNYIGGHAWVGTGYRAENTRIKDWETLQSFSPYYGDKGKAKIKSLFGRGNYAVYIEEKIAGRTDLGRFVSLYDGQAVKGDGSSVYLIKDGQKMGFETPEAYARFGKPKVFFVPQTILSTVPDGELII